MELANLQHERFCRALVDDPKGCGKAAAIAAGYSEGTAAKRASELKQRPEVKLRIREMQQEALERLGYREDDIRALITRRMTAILSARSTDVVNTSPGMDDPRRQEILDARAAMNGGQRELDLGETLVAITSELPDFVQDAVKSVKTRTTPKGHVVAIDVEMHDPIQAARVLADIYGLKSEAISVDGEVGGEVVLRWATAGEAATYDPAVGATDA